MKYSSPICRHRNEPIKKSNLSKMKRQRKLTKYLTTKKKKTGQEHLYYPYRLNKNNNNNKNNDDNNSHITKHDDNDSNDNLTVDLGYLTTLRQEAFADLHRQMQSYNDSFVIRMQQKEQQRLDVQRQRRRSSLDTSQLVQRRRSSVLSTSHVYHQDDSEPMMEELVNMLETGTIKDYSLLTEWEICQNPQIILEEEHHGGFGDLW
ncbi:uncharacterized protein BX664DRAFT_381695 [Halteromyces radiatus]|uniref:uncharacterized protein n=1 Tax=Halteromyces radiatus TaxID=101107 RepID=UPI00222024A6|nr:uncharacterized protein BX664DRAFT_381695 [Halteromyces radiatus]KAI8099084.1 hypothetical protein BX664DRAFT_381695 [Halteromyces radiatus]